MGEGQCGEYMYSNSCVMRSAGPAATRNGLSPELLIMNNNNYLPGNMPFNSMAGAGVTQPAGQNLSSFHSREGGSDNFYQQYCNRTEWSGINSSAVISNPNCQNYLGSGSKQCEHQGSILPASEYSDNQLQNISLNSTAGYSVTQNFTFTSPTQSSLQSSVLVSYTPPRFHGSRTVSHTFAPTGFTQWQHSVPQRIPWSTVGMTTQSGLSVFTGSSTICRPLQSCISSQSAPSWTTPSSHMNDPVASCSEEPRRPKRPSSENTECLGPLNKIHITEEKFAKHMEELSINCMAAADDARIQNSNAGLPIAGLPHLTLEQQRKRKFPGSSLPVNSNSDTDFARQRADYMSAPKTHNRQWKNFQELEDSLDVSDEEGDGEKSNIVRETQPTLHLVQDVPKLVPRPDIIPQNILEEIHRPRMDLMVWTPPGEALSKVVSTLQTADMSNGDTQIAGTDFISTSQSFPGTEAMLEDDDSMDIETSDSLEL